MKANGNWQKRTRSAPDLSLFDIPGPPLDRFEHIIIGIAPLLLRNTSVAYTSGR